MVLWIYLCSNFELIFSSLHTNGTLRLNVIKIVQKAEEKMSISFVQTKNARGAIKLLLLRKIVILTCLQKFIALVLYWVNE